MEKECKKILLLKGLQPLNDDQFSMVKSLMDSELELTPKMKEEYTKVKIADLMQKKFGGITCVNKLLELLKDIEGLGDIVKTIKNERRKGNGEEFSLSCACRLCSAEPWYWHSWEIPSQIYDSDEVALQVSTG